MPYPNKYRTGLTSRTTSEDLINAGVMPCGDHQHNDGHPRWSTDQLLQMLPVETRIYIPAKRPDAAAVLIQYTYSGDFADPPRQFIGITPVEAAAMAVIWAYTNLL